MNKVDQAKSLCDMARDDAQMAFDRAELAKNESESSKADLQNLIEAIKEFLEQHGARPEEIQAVSDTD